MTIKELIRLWVNDPSISGKHSSISCGKRRLFSYGTCIAHYQGNNRFIVNTTNYSCSSTKHLNALRYELSRIPNPEITLVSNIDIGTDDLSTAT